MTLWDILTAISALTPFLIGIIEGRYAGIIGIITGAVFGLTIGIFSVFVAHKTRRFIVRLLQAHERRHPAFVAFAAGFVYFIFIAWICLASFVVKFSLQCLR